MVGELCIIALLAGWGLDLCLGDPAWLPHPIVWFGKWISFWEHRLNKGAHRKLKGAAMAVGSIALVFALTWLINSSFVIHHSSFVIRHSSFVIRHSSFVIRHSSFDILPSSLFILWNTVIVFYCLAGTTLIREVRQVFLALDRSLDEGRRQVARIVGRDTSELTAQEVRTAALETLAENLSDGVIAPLFWFMLLGAPGMLAYKMVNTLDSMIGYKTPRYKDFGCWAAHLDDIANFIPARLTALLMTAPLFLPRAGRLLFNAPQRGGLDCIAFIRKYGRQHASPNSGYPEAALAAILDCRFGGPHYYFGQLFPKPYIGDNDRPLTTADMRTAVRVNRTAEVLMVIVVCLCLLAIS